MMEGNTNIYQHSGNQLKIMRNEGLAKVVDGLGTISITVLKIQNGGAFSIQKPKKEPVKACRQAFSKALALFV